MKVRCRGKETKKLLYHGLLAEKDHGVRYIGFIGDGDSSVHTTLIPGWGYAIKKLECANHACMFYCSALNSSYKGPQKKFVSAPRCPTNNGS